MKTATIYTVSHKLGRASICTSDADAICQQVNRSVGASGDSADLEKVTQALAEVADFETVKTLAIYISADQVEIEE